MIKKISLLMATASIISLQSPANGFGRAVVVTGSGDIGSEYNSNVYRTNGNQVTEWKSYIAPIVDISSKSTTDNLDLSFSPIYTYNHRREVNYFSADLSAAYSKDLSARFSFEISNKFSYSNNPASEAVPGITLAAKFVQLDSDIQDEIVRLLFADFNWSGGQFYSSNQGHILIVQAEIQARYNAAPASVQAQVNSLIVANTISRRNYVSDSIEINGHYEYFKDCLLSFGYAYSKDKNDAAFLNESEMHNPHIELKHIFSEEFGIIASYDYLKTYYQLSDDSDSHEILITPTYRFNKENLLSLEYNYEQLDFNGDQGGHDTNRFTFDFEHKYDVKTVVNLSTSPYHITNDIGADERGYDLGLDLSHEIRRGQISFEITRTIAESEGLVDWQNLRRSWNSRADLQYEIVENLESDTYLSYELRENWTSGIKNKYHDYGAGMTVSYPLNKFCTAHLEYSFKQLDSDNALVEDYKENRLVLKISVTNELWRN